MLGNEAIYFWAENGRFRTFFQRHIQQLGFEILTLTALNTSLKTTIFHSLDRREARLTINVTILYDAFESPM